MGNDIDLGDTARDSITGFEGVVVGVYKWIHGCERLTLQPRELKDGKPIETVMFDRPQLVLVSKKAAKTTGKTGGDRPSPASRHVPTSGGRVRP